MASQFKIHQEGAPKTLYVNVSGSPTTITINVVDEYGIPHNPKSVLRFVITFNNTNNICVGYTMSVGYVNIDPQIQYMDVDGIFGSRRIQGNVIPIASLGCNGIYELPIRITYGNNQSDSTYDYIVRTVPVRN